MKVFFVFLLLFILTMGLIVSIDFFMGANYSEIITNITDSKTELVGEDYMLIFSFTVPFGIAKIVLMYMEKQKKIRNQQQNEGQNTAK